MGRMCYLYTCEGAGCGAQGYLYTCEGVGVGRITCTREKVTGCGAHVLPVHV